MIWKIVNLIFKISNKIYFSDEKKSWSSAINSSQSYQDKIIFDKVIKCFEKIKNKKTEFYERDGWIFNQKPDESDLIEFLKKNVSKKNTPFQVLDYGGSLGSRYFSNYNFVKNNKIYWNIVEQSRFVKYGKRNLQTDNLKFFNSLSECLNYKKMNCVIFSGSLQYLENYYQILNEMKKENITYIFIDNLPLSNYNQNKIFVQNISKKIYNSSYPIHIFSKKAFINEVKKLNFKVLKVKMKPTVFYGFNYYSLVLENKILRYKIK